MAAGNAEDVDHPSARDRDNPDSCPSQFARVIDGTAVILSLTGEHDLSTTNEFREELLLGQVGGERLIVDLSDTEFMDSSTLSVLIAAHRRANAGLEPRLVVVARPGTPPARLFQIAGLADVVPLFASRTEASEWVKRTS